MRMSIEAGEYARATGRAQWRRRKSVEKASSLVGDPIYVRRLRKQSVTVTAKGPNEINYDIQTK